MRDAIRLAGAAFWIRGGRGIRLWCMIVFLELPRSAMSRCGHIAASSLECDGNHGVTIINQ